MSGRSTYRHTGSTCTKYTRYGDGCRERVTKSRNTGKVLSHTKFPTSRHQWW